MYRAIKIGGIWAAVEVDVSHPIEMDNIKHHIEDGYTVVLGKSLEDMENEIGEEIELMY